MDIKAFWREVLAQNKSAIPGYFAKDAVIRWPCTGERFTVDEFVTANCEYPGCWDGRVERMEQWGDLVVTVTHVYNKEGGASFHAVSFFQIASDRIVSLDEYWADDGEPPQWRKDMRLGKVIL